MRKEYLCVDFPTETVKEGTVRLRVPKLKSFVKSPSEYAPSKAPVFYNPVMELNRDIAVLAVQAYQHTVKHEIIISEALAACGAMGIRFAAEVDSVKEVVMTDINARAAEFASHNVRLNALRDRVSVTNADANFLLSSHSAPRKRFDVINIDPFGSPVLFLDTAIRALRDGGLLALTATDVASLCGVHPKACIRRYRGKPLRTEYCHELAIRLLAGCLVTTAAEHDIGINIIFSHSSDHYIRVYATAKYGARRADECVKNMGYVFHCFKCLHRETSKQFAYVNNEGKCVECGSKLDVAGPLWLGKIVDKTFCDLMKKDLERRPFRYAARVRKLLDLAGNEAEAPVGYYVVDKFCSVLKMPVPPIHQVAQELRKAGFHVFLTHFNPKALKSDVSAGKIKDVLCQRAETAW